MSRLISPGIAVVVGVAIGYLAGRPTSATTEGAAAPAPGFAAVPGEIGAQDIFGPYEVVEGWPKDLATLPGHEGWTRGAGQGIFAESPNRVYALHRGELPNIPRPQTRNYPEVGPSVQFPVGGVPWRRATSVALPGAGGTGGDPEKGMEIWRGSEPPYRELGVDARWEHCLVVIDAEGNIVEEWTQWDTIFRRPQEGNLYVAEVDAGRVQKFRPRQGANPAFLISGPVYDAWQ
jgi:hypothetical protein